MLGTLHRWLVGPRNGRPTRLSRDQALAIARRAAASDPLASRLGAAILEERSGRRLWSVRSATVGLVLVVTIDDATGAVVEMERFGVR